MTISPKHKQYLKAQAHKLKPVVMIGNKGLSPAVSKEIDRALQDHELIKIRVQGEDRDARKEIVAELCAALNAELVQSIGSISVIYRENEEE